MFKYRLISGSILLAAAFVAFFTEGFISSAVFTILGGFMLINAIKEFFEFTKGITINGLPYYTTFGIFFYMLATYFEASTQIFPYCSLTTLVIILFIIFGFINVFSKPAMATALRDFTASIFAFFYIGWSLSFILRLFAESSPGVTNGKMLLLFMIVTTKSADIGAYFVGSYTAKKMKNGNHKIFPKLSPKKSWEGLIGGVFTSLLVGMIILVLCHEQLIYKGKTILCANNVIVLAIVFTIVGFIGDIAESSFKRVARLSDSGKCLPGLGGSMDVLDSLIPIAPIFYATLLLLSK